MTLGRDCPYLPYEVVFAPEEWQAARLVAKRQPPPETPPTLGEIIRLAPLASEGSWAARAMAPVPKPFGRK
ncbi:MAG: IS4 family transposase [Methylococcales bacterium]